MNLIQLFKNISGFVRPYRWIVLITLILTLIGSLLAQVNAIVLDKTVDAINQLVGTVDFTWAKAAKILTVISIILLSKELMTMGRKWLLLLLLQSLSYCYLYFSENISCVVLAVQVLKVKGGLKYEKEKFTCVKLRKLNVPHCLW